MSQLSPEGHLSGSPDARMRAVLLVAVLMSAAYTVQVAIDVLRPHLFYEEAHELVGWLNPPLKGSPYPSFGWYKVSFWCYVLSLPAALAMYLLGRRRGRHLAHREASAAVVLLLPYPVWMLDSLAHSFTSLLLCLPSTAYALWLIHRMQRYARLPARVLLVMAGWGAVVGGGFGGSMNQWWLDYAYNYLSPGPGHLMPLDLARLKLDVTSGSLLSAGLFEELGKGAGVALAYLLLRRHIDNIVSGIVLGAASGVGFNLTESAQYMAAHDAANASTQYFLRQSLGLMAAHVAFTAAIGAGFGIARQLKERRARRTAIVCGFAIAIAGHFANDVFFTAFSRVKDQWFSPGPTVDLLVLTPLAFLLLQGPLVLLYLVLLRRGTQDQAAALAVELRAEAATGHGAVTADEVPVLLSPPRRFYLRLRALRRHGITAYHHLGRLYDAQLRLGMTRWHRSRDEYDPHTADAPAEDALRRRIAGLKRPPAPPPPTPNPVQAAS
ncbi:PrsW family intramembrane metalloprotease [Streptomyces sp. NRRL S-337]|uniref:PrsW family intramembrane metalloprotease n=1 Tax=Streptomyces sp. NRRL S-337 TaxID=1463900 RepID=UPI00099C8457|nr:PrsW family glutamic-type intramembrane protease [Streptomyces sp. NRRL S-337]